MNVKDLCLGALTFGDASGYGLKKFFETTFSQFCAAGYGSIYPALAELTTEGLVSCKQETQSGRPDRKLYHLTAAGRKVFLRALQKASPRHQVKSDFLLALYFAHLLPPAQLQSLLDERIAELEHQIARLENYQATPETNVAGSQFVRGFGKTVMRAARDYLCAHRGSLSPSAGTGTHDSIQPKHRQGVSRAGVQQY